MNMVRWPSVFFFFTSENTEGAVLITKQFSNPETRIQDPFICSLVQSKILAQQNSVQPWITRRIHGSCFLFSSSAYLSTIIFPLELTLSLQINLSLVTKLLSLTVGTLSSVFSHQVTLLVLTTI